MKKSKKNISSRCKRGLHFIQIPVCAACEYRNCEVYAGYYSKNYEHVLKVLNRYVEKYKKYKLEVYMAASTQKKTVLVIKDGIVIDSGTEVELKKRMEASPDKYTGTTWGSVMSFKTPIIKIVLETDKQFEKKLFEKKKKK